MPDELPRTPRRPKLRSSCDGCGTAKLKCDRGQPECGRCLCLGLECVYGVSRKMGKPPRNKIKTLPGISRAAGRKQDTCAINKHSMSRPEDGSCSSGSGGSIGDEVILNAGNGPIHVPSAWSSVDSHSDNLMAGPDEPHALLHSYFQGSSPSAFGSLGLDEDFLSADFEIAPIPTIASPKPKAYSVPAAYTIAAQSQIEDNAHGDFDGVFTHHTAESKDHDCSREAHSILTSLSFLDIAQAHQMPQSPLSSASTITSTAQHVPLDHILRLNRESSERLSQLLICSCVQRPQLALLYASIISRVLILYQEAAGCTTHKDFYKHASHAVDTALCSLPLRSGFVSPSPWPGTACSTLNTGNLNLSTMTGSTAVAVAPTQMAIGSFSIDDQQVQAALRIQLLLCEIRRTGSLIDLLTSRNPSDVDEFNFGDVDNLYKSLTLWLRREHSRITNIMRSRLKDITQ